jgi:putative phosphoesterase
MKIAVVSDIHDHIDNLKTALDKIKKSGCESIVFCGDYCSPFTVSVLMSSGLHIYSVFGNNDGDIPRIYQIIKPGQVEIWGPSQEHGEISPEGNDIAFCHYPRLGKLLALSGQYKAVFHGHTHQAYLEHSGNSLIANPGSVCGIVDGRYGPASFGVYNTYSNSFEHIYLFK